MANSTAGKRNSAGGVKPGAVIAVVVGVLLAVYVGLCLWAGNRSTVFPNVTVAGQDVSDMDMMQVTMVAKELLEEKAPEAFVTISYGSWEKTICAADLTPFEGYDDNAAFDAMWNPEGNNFFLKGFRYLSHLMGKGTDISLVPNYASQEQPALDAVQIGRAHV